MANFLVYRILDVKLTFKEVPAKLKDEVKQVLIELGQEELTR